MLRVRHELVAGRAEGAMGRSMKIAVAVCVGGVIAAALFVLGRVSAPSPAPRPATTGDYFAGLRAGEAQGRREGRTLQAGAELTAGDRKLAEHAFGAGYVAGANDVFAGYDGGWALQVPWIVTLDAGSGDVVYRIHDRTQLEPRIDYYLCADGHSVCHRPHH